MSENDWDVSKPINHTLLKNIPQKIRDVKSSVKVIISKEHVAPGTDNSGAQHKMGSARVYLESAATSVDPEGNSISTTGDDDGRMAILTGSSNLLKALVGDTSVVADCWKKVAVERVYLGDTMNANSKPVIGLPTATQSGSPIHVGQLDTAFFKGISTGILQPRLVGTYLAASGQDGVVVLSSRSDANRCQADGSTVFNTTLQSAAAFEDLDLSAYVGSNVAMVFLEVKASAGGWFVVKPKGYGSSTPNDHWADETSGAGAGYLLNSGEYVYLVCFCDSSGVIQIGGSSAAITYTVKLVGFTK